MQSPPKKKSRPGAWILWILFSEGLILLLALAGPGNRYSTHDRRDHGLLARFFFEEPTFWEAVGVNFILINLFVAGVFVLAWIVTRRRRKG